MSPGPGAHRGRRSPGPGRCGEGVGGTTEGTSRREVPLSPRDCLHSDSTPSQGHLAPSDDADVLLVAFSPLNCLYTAEPKGVLR